MNNIFNRRIKEENCQPLLKKTGVTIAVRLKKNIFWMVLSLEFFQTVPHIYLHWPLRECHQIQLENSTLKGSLNESITDDLAYKKRKKFHHIDDLEGKLNFLDWNYWSVVRLQVTLIICIIIKFLYPKINLPLVIESDFAVNVFCRDVEINTRDYKFPNHVTDQNNLEILIENMKKMDTVIFWIKIKTCKLNYADYNFKELFSYLKQS